MDASYPLSVDSPVPTIRYRWFTDSANFSGGCRSRIHGSKKGGAGGNRSMEKASNRVGRGVDVRKYRIRRHRID